MSCSEPPPGQAHWSHWSLRLLADRVVELGIVPSFSYERVRRVLKKNELKPHWCQSWVIPPEQNGEFVARMEDLLETYCLSDDPQIPRRLAQRLEIHYTPKHTPAALMDALRRA